MAEEPLNSELLVTRRVFASHALRWAGIAGKRIAVKAVGFADATGHVGITSVNATSVNETVLS